MRLENGDPLNVAIQSVIGIDTLENMRRCQTTIKKFRKPHRHTFGKI